MRYCTVTYQADSELSIGDCTAAAKGTLRADRQGIQPGRESAASAQGGVAVDRVDWGLNKFLKSNRHRLNVPFSELMRKQAKVDPLEAAPRLRHRRQNPK